MEIPYFHDFKLIKKKKKVEIPLFIYLYRFDDTYRLDYKTLSSQVMIILLIQTSSDSHGITE